MLLVCWFVDVLCCCCGVVSLFCGVFALLLFGVIKV